MKLILEKMPKHIGFIMDGNGRWARLRGLPRNVGHKAGAEALKKIVFDAFDLGIQIISVYGFSTENWNRPKEELDGLTDIFNTYLRYDEWIDTLNERGVRVQIMGYYTAFPEKVVTACDKLIEDTKNNDKFTLNIGINYSGRDEIVRGVNKLISEGKTELTVDDIDNSLYTANLPPLDFCIRTSGEQRISNFMIWQMAYSELYFPKVLWPDFNKKHLLKALKNYQRRNRRFGGI